MVHIFIHHAEDAQGHALAALVKHCDTQTHRQFQFLVVDGEESVARMHQFLQQQGLSQKAVKLPFIVLVRHDQGKVQRSVLHGPALHQWISEMVDAVMQTPGLSPIRIKQMFLDPFVSPHIMRLVQYATQTEGEHMPEPIEPENSTKPPVPPPPAYIEEVADEDMLVDGYVSYAVTPVPKSGSTKTRREGVVHGTDFLHNLKVRESMVQKQGKGGFSS
jgi:hypothetical protein